MTKRELIKQLEAIPVSDDAKIMLQKDPEGNRYSELSGAERAILFKDGSYVDVYNENWSAGDAGLEEDYWENIKNNKDNHCIVLWPIN